MTADSIVSNGQIARPADVRKFMREQEALGKHLICPDGRRYVITEHRDTRFLVNVAEGVSITSNYLGILSYPVWVEDWHEIHS